MDELIHIFAQEASDQLDALDALLLDMETKPTERELLDSFMRKAHNFKGAAGIVGFVATADLIHTVEGVIARLRDGQINATPELFDELFTALDVLRKTVEDCRQGKGESPRLDELRQRLESWGSDPSGATHSPDETDDPDHLTLGEYDLVRVNVLRQAGKQIYRITLLFNDAGHTRDAAAAMVFKGLRKLGQVIVSRPVEAELKRLVEEPRLVVLFGGDISAEELRERLTSAVTPHPQVEPYSGQSRSDNQATTAEGATPLTFSRTLRVDIRRLDDLLRLAGELVVNRARLQQIGSEFQFVLGQSTLGAAVGDWADQLGRMASDLQDMVMRARMVPMARLFRAMKREVRDVARRSDCSVRLLTAGGETELDMGVVDTLAEVAAELGGVLVATGKGYDPGEVVVIHARADRRGNQVVLQLDGRGHLTDGNRGHSSLAQELGIEVQQRVQAESIRFVVSVPITLATIPVILTAVNHETYGFPLDAVQETLCLYPADIVTIKGTRATRLRGRPLALTFLHELLDVPGPRQQKKAYAIVVENGGRPVGIVVDSLLGKQDVVIKPVDSRLSSIQVLNGSTVLGDGRVALILNARALVEMAIGSSESSRRVA